MVGDGGLGYGGYRKLVLGLLRMNSGKETLTTVVHHISQPSNRTHTPVTLLLTCAGFNVAVAPIPQYRLNPDIHNAPPYSYGTVRVCG